MNEGQLFFNIVGLTTPDVPNFVLVTGNVLRLSHEIEGGLWEATKDSHTYIVRAENGIALDDGEVEPRLFRRAVALGYRLDPSYFAPGYNKLLEFKLDLSDKRCGFLMNSDEALEMAIQHQANVDLYSHNLRKQYSLVRETQLRDDALVYAERLEQFERMVKAYIKEQTV